MSARPPIEEKIKRNLVKEPNHPQDVPLEDHPDLVEELDFEQDSPLGQPALSEENRLISINDQIEWANRLLRIKSNFPNYWRDHLEPILKTMISSSRLQPIESPSNEDGVSENQSTSAIQSNPFLNELKQVQTQLDKLDDYCFQNEARISIIYFFMALNRALLFIAMIFLVQPNPIIFFLCLVCHSVFHILPAKQKE